ncbi:cell wall integrity and stress response component 3-like [Odontomachus brunneus]|uniref:cell wall integrity and stress response component 3-like n=1 Tax=Odontomachus brunneus TaxID=486640 RepID=UPI0013F27CDB|nr:cell wall integrity and stress response component 3-like [Odontomachus brunneus]
MSRLSICVVLLMLFGTLLAEEQIEYDDELPKSLETIEPRLGFNFFDNLRKYLCNSSICMSADTTSYIVNRICAIKCPELYLPHGTTTPGNAPSTASPMTTQSTTASSPTTNPTTSPTTSSTTSPTTSSTTSPTTSSTTSPTTSSTTSPTTSSTTSPTTSSTTSSTTSTTSTTTTTTMMSPVMGG